MCITFNCSNRIQFHFCLVISRQTIVLKSPRTFHWPDMVKCKKTFIFTSVYTHTHKRYRTFQLDNGIFVMVINWNYMEWDRIKICWLKKKHDSLLLSYSSLYVSFCNYRAVVLHIDCIDLDWWESKTNMFQVNSTIRSKNNFSITFE